MSIKRIVRRLVRVPVLAVRNGPIQSVRLLWICLVLPVLMRGRRVWARLLSFAEGAIEKQFFLERDVAYWRTRKDQLRRAGLNGYRVSPESLASFHQAAAVIATEVEQGSEAVSLGEIDQDGFLLSHVGPLEGVPCVSDQEFRPRKRFKLSVVAVNGYLGVRKEYLGDKQPFIRELIALHELGIAGCNVPAILDVDFDALVLIVSYIAGSVLREKLADRGAILRDRDVEAHPKFVGLSAAESWVKRIREGKRVLSQVVDDSFVHGVLGEIKKAHAAGFVIPGTIKYGNIIVEAFTGKPYLIDFEGSRRCRLSRGQSLGELRDQDIERFNLHFGRAELTRRRIVRKILEQDTVYAPVYFGCGVMMGKIWQVETGYGRWHYILKNSLPDPRGKRILDLGANNAAVALELLRSGAREVIGVEMDARYREQGEFVKASFEQMDNARYAFEYLPANMKEVPDMDLGKFDMVLALCSIYYLEDYQIVQLISHISTISNIMVLQCNIARGIGRANPDIYKRASVEYAVSMLKQNGFPKIKVLAPYGYSRPLVVGRRAGALS